LVDEPVELVDAELVESSYEFIDLTLVGDIQHRGNERPGFPGQALTVCSPAHSGNDEVTSPNHRTAQASPIPLEHPVTTNVGTGRHYEQP
jgi:hypothetical protein